MDSLPIPPRLLEQLLAHLSFLDAALGYRVNKRGVQFALELYVALVLVERGLLSHLLIVGGEGSSKYLSLQICSYLISPHFNDDGSAQFSVFQIRRPITCDVGLSVC